MTLNEFILLSALGLPAGAFLLALFSGPSRIKTRRAAARWCLMFGGISTVLALAVVATQVEIVPVRGMYGVLFVGLPSLPAGMLLYFFSRGEQSHESRSNNGHA